MVLTCEFSVRTGQCDADWAVLIVEMSWLRILRGCFTSRFRNRDFGLDCDLRGVLEAGPASAGYLPGSSCALVLISAWCGLRWGEVIELRRKDIGAGCESISVSRAVTHRGSCRIDTTKSGKARSVVVPPHIRTAIKAHLDSFVEQDDSALLFTTERNACHLNETTFRRSAFLPALKSIGHEGVHIHDLRHYAGTQAARVGNLVESMNRLGHSTAKASLIYQSMVSGRDAELAVALSKLAE